jgi:hypothetical protein
MDIMEMSQEELIMEAVKAMLKHREMAEDEIYKAWAAFWEMCVAAVLAQAVIDGTVEMEWKDNKLYFSAIGEGLCKK